MNARGPHAPAHSFGPGNPSRRRLRAGALAACRAEFLGWLEDDAAAAMLSWPHSGFSAHVGSRIEPEDRASVLRVARYGARAPVAESRLRYDAARAEVELVSDASAGPYAGMHRFAALEFLARWVDHIPAKGEVRVRYYGAYASRRRGWWRGRGAPRWIKKKAGRSASSRRRP